MILSFILSRSEGVDGNQFDRVFCLTDGDRGSGAYRYPPFHPAVVQLKIVIVITVHRGRLVFFSPMKLGWSRQAAARSLRAVSFIYGTRSAAVRRQPAVERRGVPQPFLNYRTVG